MSDREPPLAAPDLEGLRRTLTRLSLRPDAPFARPERLAEALTHGSCATGVTNERLEMLGDAVLGFLTAELLFELCPEAPEGTLSRLRSSLVDERSLAGRARQLELGRWVALGKGEELSGGRDRDALLADLFEAVLAALYLAEGLPAVRRCVETLFLEDARALAAAGPQPTDWKTALQVRTQAVSKLAPTYRIIDAQGPDHARSFAAVAELAGAPIGEGRGRTKKQAQQEAARAALAAWPEGAPMPWRVAPAAEGR